MAQKTQKRMDVRKKGFAKKNREKTWIYVYAWHLTLGCKQAKQGKGIVFRHDSGTNTFDLEDARKEKAKIEQSLKFEHYFAASISTAIHQKKGITFMIMAQNRIQLRGNDLDPFSAGPRVWINGKFTSGGIQALWPCLVDRRPQLQTYSPLPERMNGSCCKSCSGRKEG